MKTSNIKIHMALVAAMVFWGLSFVGTKIALETMPTFTIVFTRFLIGALMFVFWVNWRNVFSIPIKDHGKIFLMAMFEPGLYFVFETIGLQYTTAPKASLIIATIPVVVTILAYIMLKEPLTWIKMLGFLLSFLGIGILISGGADFKGLFDGHFSGDLLILGSVVSASFYIINMRSLGQVYSPVLITALQTAYGALFFTPLFLVEVWHTDTFRISFESAAAILYLAVFATFGAFLAYNYALTKVSAYKAAMFINGIPVVTALAAWLFLGETLTPVQMAGGGIVLLAVSLVTFRRPSVSSDTVLNI